MTVYPDPDYQQFLQQAATALSTAGAQVLLPPDQSAHRPSWAEAWDQVLLLNNPGSATILAFTRPKSDNLVELRKEFDTLARGLADRGIFARGAIHVIAITVFPDGVTPEAAQRVTKTTPSLYFNGLRPSTWVVDLRNRRVYGGSRFRRSDELELLTRLVEGAEDGRVTDADSARALQQQSMQRTEAFFHMMTSRQPWVTYVLIAVNAAIFLAMYGKGLTDSTFLDYGALQPRLVEQGQWWRLFTSMFLHASVAHILFNMTSLYAVGTLAERLYGSTRFLAIYLGAGLIGSMVSFLCAVSAGNVDVIGVGASGAIFGVAAALITIRFQRSQTIPAIVRRRVSSSMLPLVVISLGISFITPNIDNSAHLGGLAGGAILSLLLPLEDNPLKAPQ